MTEWTHDGHFKTPAERRAFLIYYAKVLLREVHVRQKRGENVGWMLQCAVEARREVAAINPRPRQGELF